MLRRSVELAARVRDEHGTGWVAASVGPFGAVLADGYPNSGEVWDLGTRRWIGRAIRRAVLSKCTEWRQSASRRDASRLQSRCAVLACGVSVTTVRTQHPGVVRRYVDLLRVSASLCRR
jgi:hypothetical protein